MAETQIIVRDIHVNPETGHITYHLQSETTDGNASWRGPLKDYGVDLQMLRDRFHGNIEEWEAFIAQEHAPYSGHNPQATGELLKRKGKVIG